MTRPSQLRLPQPFAEVDVELLVDGAIIRSWRFIGLRDRPILAFAPINGRLIEGSDALPATDLWLVTAHAANLAVVRGDEQGAPTIREALPFLAGGWAGFKGLHVDFSGCRRLDVTLGSTSTRIPTVAPPSAVDRPRLAGGTRLAIALADDASPIFVGRPPELLLPLPIRAGERIDPSRWRLTVKSGPGALPTIDHSFRVDELWQGVADRHLELAVDLSVPSLLGLHPIGEFDVTARGPLGLDARFSLLIVPPIDLRGHDRLLAPHHDGAPPPARFYVRTKAHVQPDPGAADGTVVKAVGLEEYRVEVPGSLSRVTLRVEDASSGGRGGQATLSIPLRRLRWAVAGLHDLGYELTDHPLSISREELDQASAPALVLDIPGEHPDTQIDLHLEDAAGRCLHRLPPRPAGRSRWFPLRELLDTVRQRTEARLRLVVTIHPSGDVGPGFATTVLVLTRELRIADLRMSDDLVDGQRRILLTWREVHPVTNRIARLWSLWRLWDKPHTEAIPDEASGRLAFTVPPTQLPPGDYRIEFGVVDPWAPAPLTTLPDGTSSRCVDVEIGDPAERDTYLDDLPVSPIGVLERFLATRDPHIVASLTDTLDDRDLPAAIAAAVALSDVDDADALADERDLSLAMNLLRRALRERPAIFSVLADLAGRDDRTDRRLRRLVVELGTLRSPLDWLSDDALSLPQRRALWRLWTPLFLALDGASPRRAEPVIVDGAAELLGHSALDACWPPADTVDRTPRASTCALPFRYGPPEPALLHIDATLLKRQRQFLGLMPGGVLDGDRWTLANIDWLIRLRDDTVLEERARDWVQACGIPAEDDLETLSDQGLAEPAAVISQRRPRNLSNPLAALPYVVGAIALVERALARGFITQSALISEAARGYHHSPREAFTAAVELYTHDLCLMDLLVTSCDLAVAHPMEA